MDTTPSLSRLSRILEVLLTVLIVLLVGGIILLVVSTTYLAITGHAPGEMLHHVQINTSLPSQIVTTATGEEVTLNLNDVSAQLEIPRSQFALRLVDGLTGLGTLLLIGAVCWHMRQLLGSVRRGQPFTAANVRHLRRIAWLSLAGMVWQSFSKALLAQQVSQAFRGLNISVSLNFTGPSLLTVLSLFIIAEVFSIGVRMKEDQDLTV